MIRITRETDYAVVLLSRLCLRGSAVTTARELAQRVGLPLPMVSKILKALARGGLLVSHRGAKGGYSLAARAEEISVRDVIEALEGPIGITECSSSPGACDQEPLCPVRSRWQEISGAVTRYLERISISDLAGPASEPMLQLSGNPPAGGPAGPLT